MQRMSDRIPPYPLRMAETLRAQLESSAKDSGRSLNAEIAARLQASFDAQPSTEGAVTLELADARAKIIASMEAVQTTLCEWIVLQHESLPPKDQNSREFVRAVMTAVRLLEGKDKTTLPIEKRFRKLNG